MTEGTRLRVACAVLLGALLLFFLLTTQFLIVPWGIVGDSMEPALRQGDRVLVDLWTYRQRAPRPGEVALLRAPDGRPIVKRVAPLPARYGAAERIRWVLGDNLGASADSREFGPCELAWFRGRVVWRYWPLSRIGSPPARRGPGTTARPAAR